MIITLLILAAVAAFAWGMTQDIGAGFGAALLIGVGVMFALAANSGWIIVA
jgi:hypothetical protein